MSHFPLLRGWWNFLGYNNCIGLESTIWECDKIWSMKKGEDFVGVVVVYFCHDGKGNVLMSKRSENCRDEWGTWDCGGGGLEHGDTVEETLRKEIAEEYCTNVLEHEFLGYRDMHREHEGRPTHWVALDFKVLVDPATVRNGEPHKFEEVRWFPVGDLPEPLHSGVAKLVEIYKDKLGL